MVWNDLSCTLLCHEQSWQSLFPSPTPTNNVLFQLAPTSAVSVANRCVYPTRGHQISCAALLGMLEFDGASKRSKPNLKARKHVLLVRLGMSFVGRCRPRARAKGRLNIRIRHTAGKQTVFAASLPGEKHNHRCTLIASRRFHVLPNCCNDSLLYGGVSRSGMLFSATARRGCAFDFK